VQLTKKDGYENKRIDKDVLKRFTIQDKNQYFYLCGPAMFVLEISKTLQELRVEKENIIREGQ
jgi:Na+-transporting NADH:ubiquinone oxidoreductase subunit NqrF